jgi:hypothetical protein
VAAAPAAAAVVEHEEDLTAIGEEMLNGDEDMVSEEGDTVDIGDDDLDEEP